MEDRLLVGVPIISIKANKYCRGSLQWELPSESLWAVLRVARFCYDHFRFIHEDVENLNLRIAVVGIDYLQIYFPSSHEMQIITSDNICIGRINQSKTVLEKGAKVFCQLHYVFSPIKSVLDFFGGYCPTPQHPPPPRTKGLKKSSKYAIRSYNFLCDERIWI